MRWLLLFALTGCAWHRFEPASVEPPSRLFTTLGVNAEDGETNLSDLKNIGAALERWRTVDRVQFPWREGDDVELVAHVKLRQTAEVPMGRNLLVAAASGLTFFILTCCIGPEVSEVHAVEVRFVDREGRTVGTHAAQVATRAELGFGADAVEVARTLDGLQMERIAKLLAEWLFEDRARLKRETPPSPIRRSGD